MFNRDPLWLLLQCRVPDFSAVTLNSSFVPVLQTGPPADGDHLPERLPEFALLPAHGHAPLRLVRLPAAVITCESAQTGPFFMPRFCCAFLLPRCRCLSLTEQSIGGWTPQHNGIAFMLS